MRIGERRDSGIIGVMLDREKKDKYRSISDEELLKLIEKMRQDSVSTYRNDEGTKFDKRYYSFWEEFRFVMNLALARGLVVDVHAE